MSSSQAASRRTVGDEITVANLDNVGSSSSSGTFGSAMPAPAVVGNEATASGTKGIVLAVTFGKGRGIVYVWGTCLSVENKGGKREQATEGENNLLHRME